MVWQLSVTATPLHMDTYRCDTMPHGLVERVSMRMDSPRSLIQRDTMRHGLRSYRFPAPPGLSCIRVPVRVTHRLYLALGGFRDPLDSWRSVCTSLVLPTPVLGLAPSFPALLFICLLRSRPRLDPQPGRLLARPSHLT